MTHLNTSANGSHYSTGRQEKNYGDLMKVIHRMSVGSGLHRSGWPCVKQSLTNLDSGTGILLDDFVEASFCYRPIKQPRKEPWVGIFHHPIKIESPIPRDKIHELKKISRSEIWKASVPSLCGVIGLCEEVTSSLTNWLGLPGITILHPTETEVPRWSAESTISSQSLVQIGYFLRNTRLIFQTAPKGWNRTQVVGANRSFRRRDGFLKRMKFREEIDPTAVTVSPRLGNSEYDQLLTQCVLVNEAFGASANNLIVECMVRGTPLVVNRLPAIEEYLGHDYPLFFDDVSEIEQLLQLCRLKDASSHLQRRTIILPTFDQFAEKVLKFVNSIF